MLLSRSYHLGAPENCRNFQGTSFFRRTLSTLTLSPPANCEIPKIQGQLFPNPAVGKTGQQILSSLAPQQPCSVWESDSLDWKDLSAAEITKRVTSKVQAGSIVLFHNAAKHTPEALPTILETLLQEGYTFVPISELILPGEYNVDYTIDHTGKQCPAQP